jgi:macrolide transport system ATP-binding/permease protein
VGQRRRVALALLIAKPPEVLLLDEPTNHLSLSLAEELEEALRSAPGAVVIASHDRWLRRSWTGAELTLDRGYVCQAKRHRSVT